MATMIHFFCGNCGLKFQVKPEFAGRKTRCLSCKEPLEVPQLPTIDQAAPVGQVEGAKSSLAQAGVDGGVTIGAEAVGSGQKSVAEILGGKSAGGARYILDRELARGGMGAIMRAVDTDIRREVAIKYLLKQDDAKNKLRFVEEAQITGQLEHPNIVPIHELGVDGQGRVFFAMKMVKGHSLKDILTDIDDQPESRPSGSGTRGEGRKRRGEESAQGRRLSRWAAC